MLLPAGAGPAHGQVESQDLTDLLISAEQGDAEAQYNLGVRYDAGRGVPQDLAEAHRWWLRAAEQGQVNAQWNLGVVYATGRGLPQDLAEARKWYLKAAEQGRADAQYNLGVMYAKAD
jgi:TPR repeat protein